MDHDVVDRTLLGSAGEVVVAVVTDRVAGLLVGRGQRLTPEHRRTLDGLSGVGLGQVEPPDCLLAGAHRRRGQGHPVPVVGRT